jgi:DNA-binding Xre family transcriptional regulator
MTYSQTLANHILDTLKKTLTDKGIRYQTLAEAMGVSIATVKRMMNKPSLPFDTLLEICHLVGLSFEELLDRTQDAQSRRAVFTQEQDEAFHKEPGLYAFLANIFWRDKTLIDLKREYGLTDASCYLYLRKLEKLGILQLGIDNSYHFLISERISFEQHSRFARQQARQAMSVLGDYLVENMHRPNNYMALCQLHLGERGHGADRSHEGVLASGAQAQPPRHRPAGGQQDLHHVAATGGLRLPELRRSDPQHRQLIPVDPAGSSISARQNAATLPVAPAAPVASGCSARVSRQMRMASGRQCSMSQSTSFLPRHD